MFLVLSFLYRRLGPWTHLLMTKASIKQWDVLGLHPFSTLIPLYVVKTENQGCTPWAALTPGEMAAPGRPDPENFQLCPWIVNRYPRSTDPKFRTGFEKIDSKFRLRYRIDYRQRSPFCRKSHTFQKSRNFSQILGTPGNLGNSGIRFSKSWNFLPRSTRLP